MSRVFTNGLGDRGSIPGLVIPKTQKMVLDTSLLSTQHYKVRIKGKVEQSREWSSTLPYNGVVTIEKGAFGSPSTKVANFTFYFAFLLSLQTQGKGENFLVIFVFVKCYAVISPLLTATIIHDWNAVTRASLLFFQFIIYLISSPVHQSLDSYYYYYYYYYFYYYYYYYYSLRAFHTSFTCWFFTEVWVTTSLSMSSWL